jgi:hypothetical protein
VTYTGWMSSEDQDSKSTPASPEDDRFRTPEDGVPKPGEEIDLNLKKFALVFGFVLVLAAIGGAIAEFGP